MPSNFHYKSLIRHSDPLMVNFKVVDKIDTNVDIFQ